MPNIFGQYMKPSQLTTFSPSSIISSVNQSNNLNLIKSELISNNLELGVNFEVNLTSIPHTKWKEYTNGG